MAKARPSGNQWPSTTGGARPPVQVKFRTRHRRSFARQRGFYLVWPNSPPHPPVARSLADRFGFDAGGIGGFQFTRSVCLSVFELISHNNRYNGQGFFQSLPFGFAVALVV